MLASSMLYVLCVHVSPLLTETPDSWKSGRSKLICGTCMSVIMADTTLFITLSNSTVAVATSGGRGVHFRRRRGL